MSSRHCWPHEVLEIAGQPCRCRYQPSEDECHDVSPTKPGNCTRKKENMKFTYSSGLQPIELINIGRNWLAPRKRGIFSMLFSVKCVVILTTFPSTPPPAANASIIPNSTTQYTWEFINYTKSAKSVHLSKDLQGKMRTKYKACQLIH